MSKLKYTARGLRDHLNDKFKEKKTGKIFSDQDVESYLRRGHLPKYLGGNVLVEVKDQDIIMGSKNVRLFVLSEKVAKIRRRK